MDTTTNTYIPILFDTLIDSEGAITRAYRWLHKCDICAKDTLCTQYSVYNKHQIHEKNNDKIYTLLEKCIKLCRSFDNYEKRISYIFSDLEKYELRKGFICGHCLDIYKLEDSNKICDRAFKIALINHYNDEKLFGFMFAHNPLADTKCAYCKKTTYCYPLVTFYRGDTFIRSLKLCKVMRTMLESKDYYNAIGGISDRPYNIEHICDDCGLASEIIDIHRFVLGKI